MSVRRFLSAGPAVGLAILMAVTPSLGSSQEDPSMELARALSRDQLEEVTRLLASGVQPAPFHLFIATSRPEFDRPTRMLVEAGADPNLVAMSPGGSPTGSLILPATSGKVATVRLLLDLGADPDFRTDPNGMTALMAAAMNGRTEVIAVLLEYGADASLTDSGGDTALSWATLKALGSGDQSGVALLGGGSAEGETAMDLLQNGLNMDGTYQPGSQSLREGESLYAPGAFTGPCLSRRNPAMDPAHPAPGSTGSGSYWETHVRFEGGMFVGLISPPDCEPLHLAPAEYRVQVLGGDFSWVWECSHQRGSECLRVRKEDSGELVRYEFGVGVSPEAPPVPNPGEDCTVEAVEIILPDNVDQFSYDGSPAGVLEVKASAAVHPEDCARAVTWSMEDVGEISPRKHVVGDEVTFTFQGLPRDNDALGPKVIRAEAAGKSAEVTVEIFFNPTEWNNPGSGALPNWFYYWEQTRAGGGESFDYTPERRSLVTGGLAQAQYDYAEDKVYLTDRTFEGSCAARTAGYGGGESTGIDCFAEMVRHENQHKKDRHAWWGATNPQLPGTEGDFDGDLVPDHIEKALSESRACNWMIRWSCSGRPEGTLDLEMDAYATGWSWLRGAATAQDWSWCGKQWKDAGVCQGGRVW